MPDPTPFLSTIAAVSATMVAIVGALLVARFVTLTSEQEGAQQLVDDAQARLATAKRREQEARDRLYDWDVQHFFEDKVIRVIGEGERDVRELRKVGEYTALTDEELVGVVRIIADVYDKARRVLSGSIPDASNTDDYPEWEDFKHTISDLPPTEWDDVWEVAYEDLVRPPRQPISHPLFGSSYSLSTPLSRPPAEFAKLSAERRDALRTTIDRAQQQVEDMESEAVRLQRARDAIVRPKGLGWGLVVLAYFTLVGVIIPLWLMSRAPKRLTAHLGEVAFWLFLTGLLALLGYMTALALRLSGWWKRRQ